MRNIKDLSAVIGWLSDSCVQYARLTVRARIIDYMDHASTNASKLVFLKLSDGGADVIGTVYSDEYDKLNFICRSAYKQGGYVYIDGLFELIMQCVDPFSAAQFGFPSDYHNYKDIRIREMSVKVLGVYDSAPIGDTCGDAL